jgi:hypothetical protein
VAILFKVSDARVRQWMRSVREKLLKDSVLLREEAQDPAWRSRKSTKAESAPE